MSKYQILSDFLRATPAHVNEVVLSFDQISLIVPLPHSADVHRAWWANQDDTDNRPQAEAWTVARFTVESVNQELGWVKFVRR